MRTEKRIIVLDSNYPSLDNLYGDVFVHTRVKEYQKLGTIQVVSFFRNMDDYEYEGVKVIHAKTEEEIWSIHKKFSPHAVFIHFYDNRLYSFVSRIKCPVVIWVHGYEALGWYRRLFNYSFQDFFKNAFSIVVNNVFQMIAFRKLIKRSNHSNRIQFVFVSKWMKRISQTDALIKIKNSSIVPNPINTQIFKYQEKCAEDRKKILLLRSFNSNKYANDIAIESIMLLSERPFFEDLWFTIYGKGKLFKALTKKLIKFGNVSLNETFLENHRIPEIHRTHGLFLCPTRQDAQGVTMCEAMSSGLVPVTTNCTAIPEFVEHRKTGMLTRNARGIAGEIENLYKSPDLFLTISKNASKFIAHKCDISVIAERELNFINV